MVRNPIGGASMAAWQTCQKPLAGNRKNQAGFRHPQTRTQANARAGEMAENHNAGNPASSTSRRETR